MAEGRDPMEPERAEVRMTPSPPAAPLPCPFCGLPPRTYYPGELDQRVCENPGCPIYGVTFCRDDWNCRSAPPAQWEGDFDALLNQNLRLTAENEGLAKELDDAARSFESISLCGTKDQPFLETLGNVRSYSRVRAIIARAALASRAGAVKP